MTDAKLEFSDAERIKLINMISDASYNSFFCIRLLSEEYERGIFPDEVDCLYSFILAIEYRLESIKKFIEEKKKRET